MAERRAASEDGMTLVEVIVVVAILTVIASAVVAILGTMQSALVTQQNRTDANDQARLAMEALDREVRSSNFIYVSSPTDLIVHTQSNAPTAGGARCVQYVVDAQKLQRREWPPGNPAAATPWHIITSQVVNDAVGEDAFVLPDTESNKVTTGGRAVEVTIVVRTSDDATAAFEQALAGRNITALPPAPGATWPPASPPPPCDVTP